MNREQAEKMIGACLEIIRNVCLTYKPDFDLCNLAVFPNSTSAFILDDETKKYHLNYSWREATKDDADT